MTAADTVVYKLGGFVNDHHGVILNVTPQKVSLRLGNSGILPFWGSARKRQPVLVELTFGEKVSSASRGTPRVHISATVTPAGWVSQSSTFQDRAHQVLRELRGYFSAE